MLSSRTPGLEDTHTPFSESACSRHEEQTHLTKWSFSLTIQNSTPNYLQSCFFLQINLATMSRKTNALFFRTEETLGVGLTSVAL